MKIFYLNGPNSGISEELFPPTVSIGRESDNDIQLLQANVSRYHARLDYYNGKWTFLDLCSTNGSTINGKKVAHPTVLEEGDIFSVGDQHFCFGFQSQESADQSDDTKYGLPPEQTVHYANHQELQKMLAEKKEAKTVPEFISYRLTAFGILLLILFLLVATILSIRFFVQSRHLNSEIVKAQEQLFMSEASHFPKIFLYEIQYGQGDEQYLFRFRFDRDFVELTLNDHKNQRFFSSREQHPQENSLEKLRQDLKNIGSLHYIPESDPLGNAAGTRKIQIEFQDFCSSYVNTVKEQPEHLAEPVNKTCTLILDFLNSEYDLDPLPEHVPQIMEQMQKNLQHADQLLAVQSPAPEDLLETVQIYRRVMRTISQFQKKSEEWISIRKKLAEAEQRLSSAIANKQSELDKTADPLVKEQLNRELDLLLQKDNCSWKWLQKNIHNGSVTSTDKVDVLNNINI